MALKTPKSVSSKSERCSLNSTRSTTTAFYIFCFADFEKKMMIDYEHVRLCPGKE